MNAAVVTRGVTDVRVVFDRPDACGPAQAIVEVGVVGLCGTDFHIADGSYPVPRLPIVQGHEVAGTIRVLPPGYSGALSVGDRVAVDPLLACASCTACRVGRTNICREFRSLGVHIDGALQQTVAVPAGSCHSIGDLPLELGALCEPMSVSLRALERCRAADGETLVVLGCGPIGLGVVAAAASRGLRVIASDRHPERVQLAAAMGAEHAVTKTEDLVRVVATTTGAGAPAIIEATGSAAMLTAAFDLVAPGGTICVVGVGGARASVPYRNLTRDEVTLTGSRATRDFAGAVRFVREHGARIAPMVTATLDLEEAAAALGGRMAVARNGKIQVAVHPTSTLRATAAP